MNIGFCSSLALAALLALASGNAPASRVTYTDRAAFLAAAGAGTSFQSFENTVYAGGPYYDFGDYLFDELGDGLRELGAKPPPFATHGDWALVFWDNVDSDNNPMGLSSYGAFRFGDLVGGAIDYSDIYAFGVDITAGDQDTLESDTVFIGVGQGDRYSGHSLLTSSSGNSFFGVIDPGGFERVNFSRYGKGHLGFDALVYADTAIVPLPAAGWLLLWGLAAVAYTGRGARPSA